MRCILSKVNLTCNRYINSQMKTQGGKKQVGTFRGIGINRRVSWSQIAKSQCKEPQKRTPAANETRKGERTTKPEK